MVKIEKTISRDLPLINMYAWHEGYTKGMKAWLGWSYSDALFYAHDGYVDIMRPPHEHLVDFKKIILEKINVDRSWFVDEQRRFISLAREIYSFYDKFENTIETADTKQMLSFYDSYVNYIFKAMGPFITMIWLPIWLENDSAIAGSYTKEIELAIEARKISEQIFPRGDILINAMLRNINKKLKWQSIDALKKIFYEEYVAFLKLGVIPDLESVKKRNSFIFSNSGIVSVGSGPSEICAAFAKLGYKYEVIDYSSTTELKGTVACKGKAKGKVRVIMSKDKISNVQAGEVLIASMTTPEYLPAMKKAAAFVTDEGGVTCHAAIVAREMGKPCVIGTKIATKVFKDGDMVEVDAEKGIVKILK